MEEKIEKIEDLKKVSKAVSPDETVIERTEPANKDYFDALMKQGRQTKVTAEPTAVEEVQKTTLLDEVKNANNKIDPVSKTNPTELVAKSEQAVQRIDSIKEVLASPDINIKSPYRSLLTNKLTHINESLQIALSKAGAEFTTEVNATPQGLMNPVEKYLGYLTHSQHQLLHLSDQIKAVHAKEGFSPADMLAIQIKVGFVQQELEFFISLLNKALESTKTLMNVQV